jgi:hypothetical protein
MPHIRLIEPFSHLCAELEHSIDNIEFRLHSIEFGSDDERAITKAIENSFPNAKRRLCTKHLKDNVIKHYLQNRVGVNTTERNNIMSAIFGDDGLVSADDTFNFEAK